MTSSDKRQIFHTPPLSGPDAEAVHSDVPQGDPDPGFDPSPPQASSAPEVPPETVPVFSSLARAQRALGDARRAAIPAPRQPAPAASAPIVQETPEERALRKAQRKAIRREERRLKRVAEGRSPPLPGDPPVPEGVKPKAPKKPRKKKDLSEVYVQPVAPKASMRKRHWGLVTSFVLMVLIPLVLVAWYMWGKAIDQYASTAGFTVRSEEAGAATDLIGGIASQIGGSSTQTDTDILYEFIQSQRLVARMQEQFDIRAIYSQHRDKDPVFTIWEDATIEDLLWYWGRIVSVAYNQSSGLMEMRVQAFDPQQAQDIATAVLAESQILINALNEQAEADTVSYAESDLEAALVRLKGAREELTRFRIRTQIVDPLTDLASRQGVVANLEQQLAAALIEQDLLLEQTSSDDPRLVQARRKIEVIRERIAQERLNTSSGDGNYPNLLAEYESLQVDREFAEQGYQASLAALDIARTNAARQSRYLATYAPPTLPQTAEYPRRTLTVALAAMFLMLVWSIVVLIYYSIRDSK